jgi:tRNA threonylcarbamoyladenosine biosynthesis protein TsaE
MVTVTLSTLQHTLALGRIIGAQARPGQIILLAGGLGAGKTTITQAIGRGLEVDERYYITSPTFSILHEYPGRLPLYHMDFYRIIDEADLTELGIEEYFHGNGLCVVEWPERLGSLTPDNRLLIRLDITGESSRRATLTPQGPGWESLLDAVADRLTSVTL